MDLLFNILGLLIGAIAFMLINFNKSDSEKILIFVQKKENYMPILLNLIFGFIIILSYIRDSNSLAFLGITQLTFMNCALLAFTAHGIFTGATEAQTKNVKTKLGVNK